MTCTRLVSRDARTPRQRRRVGGVTAASRRRGDGVKGIRLHAAKEREGRRAEDHLEPEFDGHLATAGEGLVGLLGHGRVVHVVGSF